MPTILCALPPLFFACCSYQKNSKANKIPGKAGNRWYKNVGLGFKTPKEAIEGEGGRRSGGGGVRPTNEEERRGWKQGGRDS